MVPPRDENAYLEVPSRKAVTPERGGSAAFADIGDSSARRSSNLRVKKTFSEHDRDSFRIEAFEYIASYFQNSLAALEQRNPQLKAHFRRRGANSFEAAVYENGKEAARCGIWLGGSQFAGDIAYSRGGLGSGNSYNENLSVADDGQLLGLRSLGIRHYGFEKSDFLTLEGAAEFFWSLFIEPLQGGM